MIVRPTDFVEGKKYKDNLFHTIKACVYSVCEQLGLETNLKLSGQWLIKIPENDRNTFIEMVKDELRKRN